jgi:hypothetical protein
MRLQTKGNGELNGEHIGYLAEMETTFAVD